MPDAATPSDADARTQGIAPRRPVVVGLPTGELSEEQRLDALRRVQSQAENRVKLGMQLFKSAEARLTAQADLARSLRTEHAQLGERIDQRLDRLADQVDALRRTPSPDASPDLRQRLDQLERAVQQAVDDHHAARREHVAAIERLRREQADFQRQTRQTVERLANPIDGTRPASAQHDPTEAPTDPPAPLLPVPPASASPEPADPFASHTPPVDDSGDGSIDASRDPQAPADDARIYSNILDRLRHNQRPHIPDSDTPANG